MDDRERLMGGLAGGQSRAMLAGHKGLADAVGSAGAAGGVAGAAAGAADLHKLHEAAVAGAAATGSDVQSAHEHLHRHHMHIPAHGGRHGSGAGLIWLLVFIHLAFVAYWGWIYYKQQRARASKKEGKREPERVNCVYEFAMPTINLGGLGVGGKGEKG
ncbi:hypothetical protein N2152v2_001912 [Parachlorella kessleri]